MEGAEAEAEYSMRYVYSVGGGDMPGIDLTVPLPTSGKIIAWRVKIAWDLKTVERRIQVTSRSKVQNHKQPDRTILFSHISSFIP